MGKMINFMLYVLLQLEKEVDILPLVKPWLNCNHRLVMDIKIEQKFTEGTH